MKKVEIIYERVVKTYQRIVVEHDDNDLLNEALDEIDGSACEDIYDVRDILEDYESIKMLRVEEDYDWSFDSFNWYDQTVTEEV